MERHELHQIELTTVEMAGVAACIMVALNDRENGEFDMLAVSLESALGKINAKLRVPIILAHSDE